MTGTLDTTTGTSADPREPGSTALRGLEAATVEVLTGLWVLANVWWLRRDRSGQPLNIDEAGYLGLALNYAGGWQRGGPDGWVETLLSPSQHAPLTTAVTSLVTLTGADPRSSAFGVLLGFAVLTVAVTYAFASRLRIPGVALGSCLLLMSAPGFIALSRNFVFAVPAAAVTMAALLFLQRSDGLRRTRWAVAFGIALGLMPLARTMLIAFAAVLAVVAAAHAVAHAAQGQARRRLVNLGVAAAVAAVVAGTWLIPSGRLVYEYLTDYGYGKHTQDYSAAASSPPLRLLAVLGKDLFLPLMLVSALGWGLLARHALRVTRGVRLRDRALVALRSPLACSAAFVVGSGLALMSSENAGFGFAVPLIAPVVVVATAGLLPATSALHPRSGPLVALLAIVAFAAVAAWPRYDDTGFMAQKRSLVVDGAQVLVTTGENGDDAYVFEDNRVGAAPGAITNRPTWGEEWADAADTLTDAVLDGSTTRPDVAFGFRNRFMNVNVVQLEVLERLGYGVAISQVDPTRWGRSEQDYVTWLTTGPAATSCQLAVSRGSVNEFLPLPGTPELLSAARDVGFSRGSSSIDLPDGRTIEVWERDGEGC